jgi:S-adenosylmethionine:tRNA ribosyltransferase-isomerase
VPPTPDGPTARLTVADFDYACPAALVAQQPAPARDASRLLVLDRARGTRSHRRFADLPSLLSPGDVLVLNVSRVIPARLIGRRDNGTPAEVLLVHPEPDGTWLAMVHPGGKLKAGRRVRLDAESAVEIVAVEPSGGGLRRVRFTGPLDARAVLKRHGQVPLPPYIRRPPAPDDRERYQTVYARVDGSIAAPTAGLHFTPALLDAIRARDVALAEVVLHVGPGTFKPVEVDDPTRHVMHAEWFEVSAAAADLINRGKARAGRVWAVGTTAARVLETLGASAPPGAPDAPVSVSPTSGWTDLFIYPPFRFRVVDALLTNFHLPRSTLLMLVAAFAGHTATMAAYREAVERQYRLYSYGDAMAVL